MLSTSKCLQHVVYLRIDAKRVALSWARGKIKDTKSFWFGLSNEHMMHRCHG
jgi:hypothetical protein